MRTVGVIARGVRAPIIREGDDLAAIVTESVLEASREACFEFRDRDIVAVTESVVARAAGNYASVQDIAADVRRKFACDHLGVVFPITSRNRFAVVLRGIAMAVKKLTLVLSYPMDEVGNHLFDEELLESAGINPYSDALTEEEALTRINAQEIYETADFVLENNGTLPEFYQKIDGMLESIL